MDYGKSKEEYLKPQGRGSPNKYENLRESINNTYYKPSAVELGKDKLKSNTFTDYEVYLPVEYYNMMTNKEPERNKKEWFLRSHHVETLTGKLLLSKNYLV